MRFVVEFFEKNKESDYKALAEVFTNQMNKLIDTLTNDNEVMEILTLMETTELINLFNGNTTLISFLERHKHNKNMIRLYVKFNLANETNDKKIKYFDSLYKEYTSSSQKDSADSKLNSKLLIIETFLRALTTNYTDYTPKAFIQILKKLLQ